MIDPLKLTRREFAKLTGSGCAALTQTSMLATMLGLRMTNSVVAATGDTSDYKALVCLFKFGGADTYNEVLPYEQSTDTAGNLIGEYQDYAAARTNLSIPREDLHPITDDSGLGGSGRQFGLHPGSPELKQLYDAGKLAICANVGSLLERTNKASYQARQNLPLGLFSHADHQKHWQTSMPQSRNQVTGWGGKMADVLLDTVNESSKISMNIALRQVNLFETGRQVVPYVVGERTTNDQGEPTGGATLLAGNNTNNAENRILNRVTGGNGTGFLDLTYRDLFEKTHAEMRLAAIQAASDFNTATNAGNAQISTAFPDTSLGRQLRMVADTIASRDHEAFGHGRQIFFVTIGGYDNHSGLIVNHGNLVPVVSQAMKAFNDAMVEIGCDDNVTLFTASDFARTLGTNGKGSDHGWGGNHMIMGGAVKGGRFYGGPDGPAYPETLRNGSDLDIGRGRQIPTLSVDEYNAELALWFGVPQSELATVLPNIGRFYGGAGAPVGFLI